MRLMIALLFAAEVFAQSGGGSYRPRPTTVTLRPPWSDSLTSAQQSVGRDVAPVLVVFVSGSFETAAIMAEVKQRDADRAEFTTLKNMGWARVILRRDQIKKNELAKKYAVKTLPGSVVTDNYGNVLFPVSFAKLQTTKGLFAMAKKARADLDKLVKEIKKNYDAGQRYLKAENPGAAKRAFEKAAKYEGHELARKARAELEKLAAAAGG